MTSAKRLPVTSKRSCRPVPPNWEGRQPPGPPDTAFNDHFDEALALKRLVAHASFPRLRAEKSYRENTDHRRRRPRTCARLEAEAVVFGRTHLLRARQCGHGSDR